MAEEIYLTQLLDWLRQGRLALFIGGDLPRTLTGLPSRRELAAGLARRYGQPVTPSLASVAQRIARGDSRFEFTDYLIRELDTTDKSPQPFHYLVARLPIKHLITTAYDDLLLHAFHGDNRSFNHLVSAEQVPFVNPTWPNLFQIYGVFNRPATLVVTEDDHLRLSRDPSKTQLLERVRHIFEENAVLILGYDLYDNDFKLLWREVLDQMGQFAIGAYVVSSNPEPDEQRMWEGRRMRMLNEEPIALLVQLADAQSPVAVPRPLVDNLQKGLTMIGEFQDTLHYAEVDLSGLRYSVTQYERDYEEILTHVTDGPTISMSFISAQLRQMEYMLSQLLSDQSDLRQVILSRFDTNDRALINALVTRLDQHQADIVRSVLDVIEAESIPDNELNQTLNEVKNSLDLITQRGVTLSDSELASKMTHLSAVINAPTLDMKHGLKVSIPIIPLLLTYEGEIGLHSQVNLKAAWEGLVAKVTGKP